MKQFFTLFLLGFFLVSGRTQCFMDQHGTTWNDGWLSCESRQSPNPQQEKGHWILYNLGHRYVLGSSHWWNNNEPNFTQNGVRSMGIDISLDGVNWTSVQTFSMPEASGSPSYEGFEGPNFGNIEAKYVLLTALDNYGGNCYGFSEMKINVSLSTKVEDVSLAHCMSVSTYPNPFTQQINIDLATNCGNGTTVNVIDPLGRKIKSWSQYPGSAKESFIFDSTGLPSGIYYITSQNGEVQVRRKIVKVE